MRLSNGIKTLLGGTFCYLGLLAFIQWGNPFEYIGDLSEGKRFGVFLGWLLFISTYQLVVTYKDPEGDY